MKWSSVFIELGGIDVYVKHFYSGENEKCSALVSRNCKTAGIRNCLGAMTWIGVNMTILTCTGNTTGSRPRERQLRIRKIKKNSNSWKWSNKKLSWSFCRHVEPKSGRCFWLAWLSHEVLACFHKNTRCSRIYPTRHDDTNKVMNLMLDLLTYLL